ncbi:MAG: hypothetical protein JNL05_11650 [Flavobacteriales bacterium]|nr:hypothetical protein [Flavobacteriales bacterium]
MSKSKNTALSIADRLHIAAVFVRKAAIETTEEFRNRPASPDANRSTVNAAVYFNEEASAVRVIVNATITGLKGGIEIGCTGEFDIQFDLLLTDLSNDLVIDGERKSLDHRVAATIVGVCYSTARGMVLEKTSGTYLNGCLLPILNPDTLLQTNTIKDVKRSDT